jgi:hypothetical protein
MYTRFQLYSHSKRVIRYLDSHVNCEPLRRAHLGACQKPPFFAVVTGNWDIGKHSLSVAIILAGGRFAASLSALSLRV